MKFLFCLVCFALLPIVSACHAAQAEPELVFLMQEASSMPLAGYRDDVLVSGILKDIGDALARELARSPRYRSLPRKRIEEAINTSRADLLCDVRPDWMDGPGWRWSMPVLTQQGVIASRIDTPPITSLSALANRPLGTLLGYRYSGVEAALGPLMVREDATNEATSFGKLLAQRYDFLITNRLSLDYQRMTHPQGERLNPKAFNLAEHDSYCALAPLSRVTLAQLNRAIAALKKRGQFEAILDKYRIVKK